MAVITTTVLHFLPNKQQRSIHSRGNLWEAQNGCHSSRAGEGDSQGKAQPLPLTMDSFLPSTLFLLINTFLQDSPLPVPPKSSPSRQDFHGKPRKSTVFVFLVPLQFPPLCLHFYLIGIPLISSFSPPLSHSFYLGLQPPIYTCCAHAVC